MAGRRIQPPYRFHKKTGKAIITCYTNDGQRRSTLLSGPFNSDEWAAGLQLIPPAVHHGILSVSSLARGRSAARETEEVQPVPIDIIEQTMPYLSPTVRDIVELLLLTGMRVGATGWPPPPRQPLAVPGATFSFPEESRFSDKVRMKIEKQVST